MLRLIAALGIASTLLLSGCAALVVGGATTGAVVANDRRPTEVVLGDERVELTANTRLGKVFGDNVHINVTSFNYVVLITGEVPNEATKGQVEALVRAIPQVKSVVNELQVAGVSSYAARSNDTYLTGKVKAGFVSGDKFSANDVKVVTEAGVVYLMGLVTRKEAEDATEAARSTGGVRKVVRVFEYIAQAPQRAPAKPAS